MNRMVQTRQEVKRREIFVLVDADQYCHVSQSERAAPKIREMTRRQSRWVSYAIVEIVDASFTEAVQQARKWRAIAAMNGYEDIHNPRVLTYVQNEPIKDAVEQMAHLWPFKVKTLFPKRKLSPRDEKFEKRDRHIYVIADKFMRCYVGQSVNPRSRVNSHFAGSGTQATAIWMEEVEKDARHIVVETVFGNYYDAVWFEYKWRGIAELNGYQNIDTYGPLFLHEDVAEAAKSCRDQWPFESWKSDDFHSHQAPC